MRLIGRRPLGLPRFGLISASAILIVACSVYDQEFPANQNDAGGASSSTGDTSGAGGAAGGDSTSTDTSTSATTSTGDGGSGMGGAGGGEPPDAQTQGTGGSGVGGATTGDGGAAGTGGSSTTSAGHGGTAGAAGSAGSTGGGGMNGGSGGAPISDAGADASAIHDTGVAVLDAEASAPIGPQTLPQQGAAALTAASAPFTSACASDEVMVGFTARAGAWTDALGGICAKFSNGTVGQLRVLGSNGGQEGGTPSTLYCPPGYVASGIVGNSGRSIRFDVDELTGVGIVCRSLSNSTDTQVVAVSQAKLDTGDAGASFREECTTTRWLTSLAGVLDTNAYGQAVVRVGGECNAR